MNYKIYIVGDKLPTFYMDAIKEYHKRLSRYCKIELIFFKKQEQLLLKIPHNIHKILITTKGTSISSEELASKIDTLGLTGVSNVCILLGTENITSDDTLTISAMDMDLGLTSTILFEQIYRAYRILNNQAYHK